MKTTGLPTRYPGIASHSNSISPLRFGSSQEEFYTVHLQPGALANWVDEYANEPVKVLDWFMTDKMESEQLSRLEQQPATAENFIRLFDNPNDRVKTTPLKSWFHPKVQELSIDEPRGGWLAQLFDVMGLSPKMVEHLKSQPGTNMIRQGGEVQFQTITPAMLEKRLHQEGFRDFEQVKEQSKALLRIKSEYLKSAPNNLTGRVKYIGALQTALEKHEPLTFQDHKEPVHRYLLMRELLKQMIYLTSAQRKAQGTDSALASQYGKAFERLHKKYGLELLLKDPTVIGRQMKGAVLWNHKLGITIKQPPDVAAHTIAHYPSEQVPYVDPIGQKEPILHLPKAIGNAPILTARAQLEQRIKQQVEPMSRLLGMPTEYSLIAGIETQRLVKGTPLKQVLAENPKLWTKAVMEQFVLFQLLMEKYGLELVNWSLQDFIVSGDIATGAFKLYLVDLGDLQSLSPEQKNSQDEKIRRQRISNIAESASHHQKQLGVRIDQYLQEIETKDLERLKRKADELFIQAETRDLWSQKK